MPHIIIILMTSVACLSQARGQEIYQAKIYVDKNKHKIEITCSTHGLKKTVAKDNIFYIYLCRNGIGIDVKSSCQDATFYIDDTTKDSTGDYSCVFSVNKKNPSDVRGNGINSIFIIVNDSFIPAEIALLETNVKTGDDVVFQCTSEYMSSERTQKGNIYAYLSKNSTVIQMTIWNTIKNNTRFTINEVTMQDAGRYICFLMSEPCPFPKKVHSINEVNLHVHVNGTVNQGKDNETLKITVGVVFMLLLIFLSLGLWAMYRKQGCIKDYCERPSEDQSDSIDTDVNQDQLQNAQSFASEWDDSKDSDRNSYDDVYQVCEDP